MHVILIVAEVPSIKNYVDIEPNITAFIIPKPQNINLSLSTALFTILVSATYTDAAIAKVV